METSQRFDDSDEELLAIKEGLASIERGEAGVPLDEAFARLRDKYQIRDER